MIISGAQFVMMLGVETMLTWCVDNLVSHKPLNTYSGPIMARDPAQFGWITWLAQEVSHLSAIVVTVVGAHTTVVMVKTLVYSVVQ